MVSILGNFVNRVMVLTWKYFDGKVPSEHELPGTDDRRKRVLSLYTQAHADLDKAVKDMADALKNFRFREAQFQMLNLSRIGNKFLADTEPWKLAKEDMEAVGCILNYALTIVGNIALAMEPFLPDGAASICKQLNSDLKQSRKNFWEKAAMVHIVPQGHSLGKAELLYRNVEDTEIEKQTERLKKHQPVVQAAAIDNPVKPLKPEIVFDDFAKLDIRIGTVTAAEKMEKSNKLLKLRVDDGLGGRTILSGIALHYTPEEMIGKQVTFIANLAPRKMMGTESQGMILMAEDKDGKLKLVSPIDEVSSGSQVS
jgi:methionyl-tRNA synthetase